GEAVAAKVGAAVMSVAELQARAGDENDADVRTDGLTERHAHVVFFTSGSTGRPKGSVISHRVNYLRTHPGTILQPRGPMVCPFPLFHMAGWTIALGQWHARDRIVFTSADAEVICVAIARHRATRFYGIPGVWR